MNYADTQWSCKKLFFFSDIFLYLYLHLYEVLRNWTRKITRKMNRQIWECVIRNRIRNVLKLFIAYFLFKCSKRNRRMGLRIKLRVFHSYIREHVVQRRSWRANNMRSTKLNSVHDILDSTLLIRLGVERRKQHSNTKTTTV